MKTDVDTCLKDIADWYVKNRRSMTEPELEAIALKHCESEAEVRKFVGFLETEPGQLRFKTHLRERKPSTLTERKVTPVTPEVAAIAEKLATINLPNVKVTGSYASGRATIKSDIDILVGVPDAEWDKVTLYNPPDTVKKLYDTLPEDKMSIHLYKLSKPNELWHFQRPRVVGREHLSGVFLPVDYPQEMVQGLWKGAKSIEEVAIPKAEAVTPEVTLERQGKLVQRSYRTPVGIVVDYGIQIGDIVYEPRASAVSPLGVSEAKKGWREVSGKDRENYREWEKKTGAFGNRARKIADIEKRWDEIIAKGKTSQEHEKEQLASYESYVKRRAEAERQYSLKSSDLSVGMALEEIATGNRYVITEKTDEGIVFARPESEPTQSGGLIGRGEVKGYRLAIQKVAPEVAIPKTRVTSLGFLELELPVARAVEALVNENPWSSGFHGALNQRWAIVFKGKISDRAVKAAEAAGLEVSYREAPVGSGQILTDVSLPGVGVSEIEKVTQVFNRFAELYESKPSYSKGSKQAQPPIIHEATSESPDPAELMPVDVPSAFPKGAPSTFNPQEKAQIDRFINEVPDKNDTRAINYWLDWGDKKVYLEGWIDKCLTGTGFPPMEGGEWDEKIQYMVRDTHRTLIEKQTEKALSPPEIVAKLPLTLIEGGFREFEAGDKAWLYGVTWGVYKRED